MSTINQDMITAIKEAHRQAQQEIEKAHQAVKSACDAAIYAGALVEKAQRSKRNSVYSWLGEEADINGQVARSYLLAHTTAAKRHVASDRRALVKLNIIEPQVKVTRAKAVKPQPVSLASKVTKASKQILGHVNNLRPIETMSESEKDLIKARLEPMARLYMDL